MLDSLRRLFKKADIKKGKGEKVIKRDNPHISQADDIRKYAKMHYVIPARKKGENRVVFSANNVHKGMDLQGRYPLVCASIDAKKFKEFARVELIKREGPKQGASAQWTFKILT